MTYEELETLINSMREKIGEDSSALISEDTLNVLSSYKGLLDQVATLTEENAQLKADKEELLKTNGKLFQKIGFEKEEEAEEVKEENEEQLTVDEILDDLIDEKGEIKDA